MVELSNARRDSLSIASMRLTTSLIKDGLIKDGVHRVEVPGERATRVRVSVGHGHKSDDTDAVGIAALTGPNPS